VSDKFSLSPTVVLRSEPNYYSSYAAFDYDRATTEFLTQQEHRALEYISNGPADPADISRETGMKLNECKKFLKRMLSRKYVTHSIDTIETKARKKLDIGPEVHERFPLPFLSAPATVDLFITSRCNLNCVHCFSSKDDGVMSELNTEKLQSIFDQLEDLRVLEVRINGGEPLLHSRIGEVLMSLKKRRFRKVILTNGTLLDDSTIDILRDSRVIPTVSLDGCNAEEHDLFRRTQGSFARTLKGLRLLQNRGIRYGINCCLHKRNLNKCAEITELAVKYGASRISFLDLRNVGRMRKHPHWIPAYREYRAAVPELVLSKIKYRKEIDVALDTFLHCHPLKECAQEAERGYVSCHAGIRSLSIDSDGSIYPCNLVLSDKKWNMGNLGEEAMEDVWFSDKWLFFRGGVRVSDLEICRDCHDLKRCKDFYCRLLSYVNNDDPFGPHPKCRRPHHGPLVETQSA